MEPGVWVLWNPTASRAEQAQEVRRNLEQRSDTVVTELGPGCDVASFAQKAVASNVRLIVAAGGDGTANLIVNALSAEFKETVLAILPLGTANDFSRTLCVPEDPLAAADLIDHGDVRRVDVVRAVTEDDTRYCLNMAAAGNSTDVLKTATKDSKRFWGRFAYLRHAVARLFERKRFLVTVEWDQQRREVFRALNIVVANGCWGGGNFHIAPNANPEDGMMDIFLILDGDLADLVAVARGLLMEEPEASEKIVYRRASHVRIEAKQRLEYSIDGDVAFEGPVSFEVAERAVPVVVGPDYCVSSSK